MKSLQTLVVCLLVAASAIADIDGAWTAQIEKQKDRVYLNVTRQPFNNWGTTYDLSELGGLTRAQIESATATPIQFQLRHDAGVLAFEGTFRRGVGAGQFTFTPNRAFMSQIRALGISTDSDRTEEDELFRAAMSGVSVAYAREMHGIYADADLRGLSKLKAVGVTTPWLREMREAGVAITNAHDATKLAAMGVSVKFIRELADAGYRNLSVHDLTRLAAVGVDGNFIREMEKYKK